MSKKKQKKAAVRVRVVGSTPDKHPFIITGDLAPLSIHFDETNTVMYVRVSHNAIESTRELPDDVLADYDAEGDLVGFEIIGYQNGRAGSVLKSLEKAFPKAAPAINQLRELVPA